MEPPVAVYRNHASSVAPGLTPKSVSHEAVSGPQPKGHAALRAADSRPACGAASIARALAMLAV